MNHRIDRKIRIDLNADLGEGAGHDRALMQIISSASVACGAHAGSPKIMAETLIEAKRAGVTTGAHPGFVDRENFGRNRLDIPVEAVAGQVVVQLNTITDIARKVGQKISYVKLHGALYNWASADFDVAMTLFKTVKKFDPTLCILALDNSAQLRVARELGLKTISEAFVDRAYDKDGLLVSRGVPGAVFDQPEKALQQALGITKNSAIRAIDGTKLSCNAQSLCLHGDNKAALELARAVRDGLQEAGIEIRSVV